MKQLTIILAHSDYSKSIANKTVMEEVQKQYPDVQIRNIAALYPDFAIDVEAEQQNLVRSDVVLLQFPVNWYNMPAIMKQWLDKVLTFGFAYGPGGDKLKGKTVLLSITAGAMKESYTPIGHMHFRLEQFFNNVESTCYYSQMNFAEPVLGYGNIYVPGVVGDPEIVKQRAREQAGRVLDSLAKLLA